MLKYKLLPYIDPEQIFVQVAGFSGVIYLDSSHLHEHYGRYSFILLNPIAKYKSGINSFQNDLPIWKKLFESQKLAYDPELPPFTSGLAGYFSYDLSKQIESIPGNRTNEIPDYFLGLYNQVIAFDHFKQICYLMVYEIKGFDLDYQKQMDELFLLYKSIKPLENSFKLPVINLKSNYSKFEYMKKVEDAREHILNGDIFEVNLAQCFSSEIKPDYPLDLLYRKLRSINKAPFSAYLKLDDLYILSASPERFLSVVGNVIETRPIKGTCKRSSDDKEDKRLANWLHNSSKDRAENIMIVDLMRNDLGKICKPASIKVSQLCGVESFTNVHHLVSVIKGELEAGKSIFDVIPACFPGGSITGAPKIRAMQVIEELEGCSRGVYCGSIGYFGFNGNVDLSIAIRTLVCYQDTISFQVGGAITLDSMPEDEFNETLIKGQKLMEAINSGSN